MSKGSEQREAPVRFDEAGGVLTVTLERDSALNAVTAPMLRTIERELTDRAANEELRLVVLRGVGRGFCSGADLGGESGSQDLSCITLVTTRGEGVEEALGVVWDVRRGGDLLSAEADRR